MREFKEKSAENVALSHVLDEDVSEELPVMHTHHLQHAGHTFPCGLFYVLSSVHHALISLINK